MKISITQESETVEANYRYGRYPVTGPVVHGLQFNPMDECDGNCLLECESNEESEEDYEPSY